MVEIQGQEIERFINLCINNKLIIYDIEKYKDKIIFSIDIEDYRKIKKIARKTRIVPRIKGRYGLPFLIYKASRRKSFFIGIFLGILLFYICSLYVWDIRIEGDNYYTHYEIKKYLETQNIKYGMPLKNIVCKNIEDSIRRKYKDIGWVSAQIKGTRLIIQIKENIKFNKNINTEEPRHIIASTDGIVKSILVKQGEPQVSIGQEVKKGQVLVYGVMDIVDDAGVVINKHGIYASADISIQCDKEYYFTLKKQHKKKNYTRKIRNRIDLNVADKNVFILWPLISLKKFDNYDVLVNNYNVRLGQNLELPVEIIHYKEREYNVDCAMYSDKELKYKANEYFKKYRRDLKKENITIVNSNIDNYIEDNVLYSKGYVTLLYNNMDYKAVEDKDLKVEIDKREQ